MSFKDNMVGRGKKNAFILGYFLHFSQSLPFYVLISLNR